MIGNLRHIDRNEHIWWWELYKFSIIPFAIKHGTPLSTVREICDLELTGAKIETNNAVNFLWIRMQTSLIAQILHKYYLNTCTQLNTIDIIHHYCTTCIYNEA